MTAWNFTEGDELAQGLRAVRLLGGGRRYEAHLAWSDHLRALVVAKVIRRELVDDAGVLAGLRGEARMLDLLAHPKGCAARRTCSATWRIRTCCARSER
jgi:hypothetical protein